MTEPGNDAPMSGARRRHGGRLIREVPGLLSAAWRYRGFIVSAAISEIRGRLARSQFGFAWVVIQPLAQVLVFATVLSSVLAARIGGVDSKFGYAAYLLAGILCWSLFAEVVQRLLTVFIDNASMLKKISFPRAVLPLVAIGGALVNHVALATVLLLILPLLGFMPGLSMLWLLPLGVLTVLFATGIGLICGVLNVFVRDVGQVMAVVLQFWFWVTPIVYPVAIIPDGLRPAMALNPAYYLVNAYHDVLVFGRPPGEPLWPLLLLALALLAAGWTLFRRASAELVDAL